MITAAINGTTATSSPAVELFRRVSACPSSSQGTLISMSVKAMSHCHFANAGTSTLRRQATGNSSNAPMTVRPNATTSGSKSATAMRMSK